MIIINTKNYRFGNSLLNLAKQIKKFLPNVLIAVPPTEIFHIKNTRLKVYAQHLDYFNTDKATGFIIAQAIKSAGASGTLLNHSEHKISIKKLAETIKACKKLNLEIIVCAANLNEVKKIIKLKPDAIAFEDPKLISTGKSITKYNSKELRRFIEIIKNKKIIPICGAGISTSEDVKGAYALGCKGVLIASAIANSKNPVPLLKQLKSLK